MEDGQWLYLTFKHGLVDRSPDFRNVTLKYKSNGRLSKDQLRYLKRHHIFGPGSLPFTVTDGLPGTTYVAALCMDLADVDNFNLEFQTNLSTAKLIKYWTRSVLSGPSIAAIEMQKDAYKTQLGDTTLHLPNPHTDIGMDIVKVRPPIDFVNTSMSWTI